MKCEHPLHKLKRNYPFSYELNIYRGCGHRCKYCFAMYTHQYVESNHFFDDIYVKENVVEKLEKDFRKKTWEKDVISIGGVTDSYQPIERELKLMPEILKLCIKYKVPTIISTKSNLILRDYDLIDQLSHLTYVNIAETITTIDERIRKNIEPGGSSSLERFQVLKEFKNTNASVGLHVMPIIPYLTDTFDNINGLFQNATIANVDYVLPGVMYLRGKTKEIFLKFIQNTYPDIYTPLIKLYIRGEGMKEYKNNLYRMVNQLKEKYHLSSNYSDIMKKKLPMIKEPEQLSFL